MSSFSTHHSLPYLENGQAEADVPMNETINRLDNLVHTLVVNRSTTAPPGGSAGDRYIIAATATGVWAGRENYIAQWTGTTWVYYAPKKGMQVYCDVEACNLIYTGTVWQALTGETVFAARRTTTQSVSGATDIEWDHQLKHNTNSRVFAHDTSTDPENITLNEAGDYHVEVQVSIAVSSTAGWSQAQLEVTLNGTGVTGGKSFASFHTTDIIKNTMTVIIVVTATANQILRAAVTRNSGVASTYTIQADSRITVRKV
jgi:hypothetical protein